MKFIASLTLVIIGLVLGSCSSGNNTKHTYAYVQFINFQPQQNITNVYGVAADGSLYKVSAPTIVNDINAVDLVVNQNASMLYMVNSDGSIAGGTIGMYQINNSNGVLIPSNPATVSAGFKTENLTITNNGKYAYSTSSDNAIAQFSIMNNGILQPLAESQYDQQYIPYSAIVVTPNNKYAYFSEFNNSTIAQLSISESGVLSPLTTPRVATTNLAQVLQIAPNGSYLYSVENSSNAIFIYQIANDGNLTNTMSVSLNGVNNIIINQAGTMLYATDDNGNISSYSIANDGGLNLVSTVNVGSSKSLGRIAIEPQGQYLYAVVFDQVANASNINIYSIQANGALNYKSAFSPAANSGNNPLGIVFYSQP